MSKIPEIVQKAWGKRAGFPVFTTVDSAGAPNAIYVGALGLYDDSTIVIADNYMHKTKANILAGSQGALVFISEEKAAYQLKGSLEYTTSGPYFDFMKSINPEGYPGHAAVALKVKAVYLGAEKLTD